MDGNLENVVLRLIQEYMLGRYTERHGMVTAYDPKKHLAKVMFQPGQQESGWLPIETGHIGAGYGIAIGLQPGDGKKTGDQVIVRYQEGDLGSGKIVQRVHSEDQQAPEVQSGELVIWARFQNSDGGNESAQGAQGGNGQRVFFKNDGSIVITDGNGATITMDGNGNITTDCKKYVVNASSDIKLISTANALLKGASSILYATGSAFIKALSAINAKAPTNKVDPDWVNGASDPPISS
jgi:phage baseplate assembly protein gpV